MGSTSLTSGTNETPAEATKFITAICASIVPSVKTYFGLSRLTIPVEALKAAIALSGALKTLLAIASTTDFLRTLNASITKYTTDASKSLFRDATTASCCRPSAFEMSSAIYLTDAWPKALFVPPNNAPDKTSSDARLLIPSKTHPKRYPIPAVLARLCYLGGSCNAPVTGRPHFHRAWKTLTNLTANTSPVRARTPDWGDARRLNVARAVDLAGHAPLVVGDRTNPRRMRGRRSAIGKFRFRRRRQFGDGC